jgi:tRNA(Ile)-lysidine synthase
VALSGGADSSALLLAACLHWPGCVRAVHVHHGLQAAADGFARHCAQLCARLDVPLAVLHVDARHASGDSPEAAAREARYLALSGWARDQAISVDTLLLGHHADDQLESVLLALSRGAGVAGLAAMAPAFERHGTRFARPFLGLPGDALRDWLRLHGLGWVDDPTNADPRYTRNRIRQLLPALLGAFPALRETAARSARLCAQASEMLNELATQDLAQAGDGTQAPDLGPRIAALQALSRARQANALRAWLRGAHQTTPTQAQLDALLVQIAACRTRGHRIHIKAGSGFVQRAGERLAWQPDGERDRPAAPATKTGRRTQ